LDQVIFDEQRTQNNEHEDRGSPGKEKNVGRENDEIFIPFVGNIIYQQKDRQKIKNEKAAAENHIRCLKPMQNCKNARQS
jgi:hypothetical protein